MIRDKWEINYVDYVCAATFEWCKSGAQHSESNGGVLITASDDQVQV